MIESEKRTSLALLEQSKNIIDKYLDEVDLMVKRIAFNGRIESFLNTGMLNYGSPDLFDFIDAYNELTTYRINNSLIKDFYIHSRNTGAIISTNTTYTSLQQPYFYENFFKFGNMDVDAFRKNILDSYTPGKFLPKTDVYLNKRKQSVITYIQSIPVGSSNSRKGDIMVLLDESIIQKLIEGLDIGKEGNVFVLDGDGRILTSVSDRKTAVFNTLKLDAYAGNGFEKLIADGREVFVTYTASSDHKWKYISIMPYSHIISKVAFIKRIILMFTGICLLVGVFLAWFLAYRYSKPLKEIIETFADFWSSDSARSDSISNNSNGYEYIKGSISGLITQSRAYQKRFEEQAPILRSALYKRLLAGDFKDIAEIDTTLAHIGISMRAECFTVLLVEIQGYGDIVNDEILKELVLARMIVRDILSKALKISLHAYDHSEDTIAVILAFDTNDKLEIYKEIERLLDENRDKASEYGIIANYYVGKPYLNMTDIHNSFQEALRAADFNEREETGSVVWYKDIPKKKDNYYYPIELESRLINFVKAGDKHEVEKLLTIIYTENITKRKLNLLILRPLLYALYGTLVRIIEGYNDDSEIKSALADIDMQKSITEVYDAVSTVYYMVCDEIARKRDNRNSLLREELLEYINGNFMHAELNIAMVASSFKMSETYVYQFFKENVDETLASYLENLRAEKACDLLATSDLSIEEISENVGYTSSHSFRRAFKRYKGIIPSVYRELHRKC